MSLTLKTGSVLLGALNIEQTKYLPSLRYQLRFDLHVAVADDMVLAIPVIHFGLEDLDSLPRDLRAPQPSYELFALSAEHAAADHLDPSEIAALRVSLLAHMAGSVAKSCEPHLPSAASPQRERL